MARLSPRLTACVGVIAAFLLLGGTATVAVADPGGSQSDRDNSVGRGNGDGNGRGGSDRGDEERVGKGDEGDGDAGQGGVERPEARFGSGRIDVADVAEAPSLAAGSGNDGPESRSVEEGASVFGGVGAGRAPSGSGVDRAGLPSARFDPPRVTFGNGRTPGTQQRDSEPQWRAPVAVPAPAAPPPPPPAPKPAPAPSWVVGIPATPVLTQQMGEPGSANWSDPLWGVAGLLLIPAAGAVLGYRQARAAHAAERLRRS